MKKNFDEKYRTKIHEFQIGDEVLVNINPISFQKSLPKREIQVYKIVKIKRSMITAVNNNKEITRNSSFFKKWRKSEEVNIKNSFSFENMDDNTDENILSSSAIIKTTVISSGDAGGMATVEQGSKLVGENEESGEQLEITKREDRGELWENKNVDGSKVEIIENSGLNRERDEIKESLFPAPRSERSKRVTRPVVRYDDLDEEDRAKKMKLKKKKNAKRR